MVNGSNQKAMVTASAERRRVLKPRATGGTFTGKRGLPARPAATNPSPEDRAGAVITSSSTISQRKKPAVSPSTDRLVIPSISSIRTVFLFYFCDF